jgi:hypothetical protein
MFAIRKVFHADIKSKGQGRNHLSPCPDSYVCLFGAKQPVAGVAKARHDVAVLVELLVTQAT